MIIKLLNKSIFFHRTASLSPSQFKAEYKAKIGEDFPDDPKEQLMGAIKAVFRSWDNPRANVYRHTWHRSTGAGTYGYKKWIFFISEFLTCNLCAFTT